MVEIISHENQSEKVNHSSKVIDVVFNEEYRSYDISMLSLDKLALYDFVEIDLSFFPLSRHITSGDYTFEPFEHHIDESKNKISTYKSKLDVWKVLSGLTSSALLGGIAAGFDPKNIFEVGSLFALGASYYAGAQSRPEIESILINSTSNSKMQFKERYFEYREKQGSTAERYDNYAQRKRFGMEAINPRDIGLVVGPARQKARLRFTQKQFRDLLNNNANKANILNITIPDDQNLSHFTKDGVQIGVHLKLGRQHRLLPFVDMRTELIQTLVNSNDETHIGSIQKDSKQFTEGTMELRETASIDRIKYYRSFEEDKYELIGYRTVAKKEHESSEQ